MALSDYTPDTITVPAGKTSFDVRGLSFLDLSSLLKTHYEDLTSLFDLYENDAKNPEFSNVAMARYATALIKDAPGLVSHLIALAADEPEMVNAVHRLPLLSQVDALRAIGKLTFEEVGGVKKLMGMIAELATELKSPDQNPSENRKS